MEDEEIRLPCSKCGEIFWTTTLDKELLCTDCDDNEYIE